MAAEHVTADDNIGEVIIHHVSNGDAIIPIHVPIGSYTLDLSITKAAPVI